MSVEIVLPSEYRLPTYTVRIWAYISWSRLKLSAMNSLLVAFKIFLQVERTSAELASEATNVLAMNVASACELASEKKNKTGTFEQG